MANEITEFRIRIQLVAIKKRNNRFFSIKKNAKLVQGEPIEIYLRFTNIGHAPTSVLNVTDFNLTSKSDNVTISSPNSLDVKPLNPGESIQILQDKISIGYKGSAWASLKIQSKDENVRVITYQHNEDHNLDDVVSTPNAWGDLIYIQGELEVLQHKTNLLILVLTIVTVIDSLFGMKESLTFLAKIIYIPIILLADFLGSVIK